MRSKAEAADRRTLGVLSLSSFSRSLETLSAAVPGNRGRRHSRPDHRSLIGASAQRRHFVQTDPPHADHIPGLPPTAMAMLGVFLLTR